MVTLKDIARQLGVAPSTVGRALAGDARIGSATSARVRAAAARMGYVAHAPARIMRGGASSLLGLVIPDVQNDFYSTLARAMSERYGAAGYQLLLSLTDDDPDRELDHVKGLFSARAAGLVVVPTPAPRPETVAILRRMTHVQLIRRSPRLRADWFGIDDVAAARLATAHLLRLGHRRIGYVGGPMEISTGARRLEGFRSAYRDAGVDATLAAIECGGCDAAFGRLALDRLLARTPRPTAIVTAAARGTVGVLEGLAAHRIRVPDELSIVGFTDSPAFAWWGPGLTTVGLPVREIAVACAALLVDRIREGGRRDESAPPALAEHAPFLVERGSTAPHVAEVVA